MCPPIAENQAHTGDSSDLTTPPLHLAGASLVLGGLISLVQSSIQNHLNTGNTIIRIICTDDSYIPIIIITGISSWNDLLINRPHSKHNIFFGPAGGEGDPIIFNTYSDSLIILKFISLFY